MSRQVRQFRGAIAAFSGAKIAVLGDFTADVYVYGKPHRVSREAPVVVARYERESMVPGGAANAVINLWALGAKILPVGVVGEDAQGRDLVEQLIRREIPVDGIARDPRSATITKTRFMVGDAYAPTQQVFRIDHHADAVLHEAAESTVLESLDKAAGEADALLVSDKAHSVLTEKVAARVREIAASGKLVCADSHARYEFLKGVRIVTPNQREAEYAAGILARSEEDVVRLGFCLLELLETAIALITRGNQGMILFEGGGNFTKIPVSNPDDVIDVTGAGDTVSSVVTLALATGADPLTAALLANHAAGMVVMQSGSRAVSAEDLLEAILDWKEEGQGR